MSGSTPEQLREMATGYVLGALSEGDARAFAAFLDHTDAQLGRLVGYLESVGEMENTLILLLSDNGASAGGGATGITNGPGFFGYTPVDVDAMQSRLDNIGRPNGGFNDIPWGWAQAGNTPLRWYKQNTHGGGVRDPAPQWTQLQATGLPSPSTERQLRAWLTRR